ncbi:MAG: ABC transporter ATP-binding protein [Verrucomicrobiota bacterium]
MNVTLKNIQKSFGSTQVVKGVDIEIESGELFFLLGSSGCGKTTLLRMMAGFYEPDAGDIVFGDKRINGTPPHDRNTALVFQNYAVWPHMTVFENVAYGLRVRKLAANVIKDRVNEALSQVQMDHLADRKPAALSGGQQQRVALARAIVVRPDLLLFDEPLCNLDAKLRIEMRDVIKKIHLETKITAVYVTHDQEEALSMADRMAVMDAGTIQQVGAPPEVYTKPANEFVASFIGEINMLNSDSEVIKKLNGPDSGKVGFRPEHVRASKDGIPAKVTHSSYLGSKNEVSLKTDQGTEIKAWLNSYHEVGDSVKFTVDKEYLLSFSS